MDDPERIASAILKLRERIDRHNRNIEHARSYETAIWTERMRNECQAILDDFVGG